METSRFAEKLKNREWTQMNANRKDSEIACLLLVLQTEPVLAPVFIEPR
jgi:hypothetical protein